MSIPGGYGQLSITQNTDARLVYASNQTTSTLATLPLATSLTQPSGDGYFKKSSVYNDSAQRIDNHIVLAFFGTDAANEILNWRVSGVKRLASGTTYQWLRAPLAVGTATLGAMVGIANGVLSASQFIADTISITTNTNSSLVIATSATVAEGMATLLIDMQGYEDIYVEVAIDGGTPVTNANAIAWTI